MIHVLILANIVEMALQIWGRYAIVVSQDMIHPQMVHVINYVNSVVETLYFNHNLENNVRHLYLENLPSVMQIVNSHVEILQQIPTNSVMVAMLRIQMQTFV